MEGAERVYCAHGRTSRSVNKRAGRQPCRSTVGQQRRQPGKPTEQAHCPRGGPSNSWAGQHEEAQCLLFVHHCFTKLYSTRQRTPWPIWGGVHIRGVGQLVNRRDRSERVSRSTRGHAMPGQGPKHGAGYAAGGATKYLRPRGSALRLSVRVATIGGRRVLDAEWLATRAAAIHSNSGTPAHACVASRRCITPPRRFPHQYAVAERRP